MNDGLAVTGLLPDLRPGFAIRNGLYDSDEMNTMRKRIITPTAETIRSHGEGWLDVERAALVEITSEEPNYPIESVFASGQTLSALAYAIPSK